MNPEVYALITSMTLEDANHFKSTQYKKDRDDFRAVERYFARKYGYPPVNLSLLVKIDQATTKTDAAIIAIRRGDYPSYIGRIMYLPDFEPSEVIGTALNHRRTRTIAHIASLATEEDLVSAIRLGYQEGAQSILKYVGLKNIYYYELRDLIWIFENLRPIISNDILPIFLCNKNGTKEEFEDSLELLTFHCSPKQIDKLRILHKKYLLSGRNFFGEDYLSFGIHSHERLDLIENIRVILDAN